MIAMYVVLMMACSAYLAAAMLRRLLPKRSMEGQPQAEPTLNLLPEIQPIVQMQKVLPIQPVPPRDAPSNSYVFIELPNLQRRQVYKIDFTNKATQVPDVEKLVSPPYESSMALMKTTVH